MSGALSGQRFFLAPRWDAAQYDSRNEGAAAFSYVVAMPFSTKASAPERLAVQHIKDAYASPATGSDTHELPGQPRDTRQDDDRELTRHKR